MHMDTQYGIAGATHIYLGKYVGRELFISLSFVVVVVVFCGVFFATSLFFQFLQYKDFEPPIPC